MPRHAKLEHAKLKHAKQECEGGACDAGACETEACEAKACDAGACDARQEPRMTMAGRIARKKSIGRHNQRELSALVLTKS